MTDLPHPSAMGLAAAGIVRRIGERVIVDPNGAGKTTLLEALAATACSSSPPSTIPGSPNASPKNSSQPTSASAVSRRSSSMSSS